MKAYLKCENTKNHKIIDLKIEGQECNIQASYDELLEFKKEEGIADYDVMQKERLYTWLEEYNITLHEDSKQWLDDLKNAKWKILGWTEAPQKEVEILGF